MTKHEWIGITGRCILCGVKVSGSKKFCIECARLMKNARKRRDYPKYKKKISAYYKAWYKKHGRKRK